MVNSRDSILKDYQNRIKEQQALTSQLKKRLNTIALSRLGLFVAEILLIALLISLGFNLFLTLSTLLPILGFLGLVKKQASVENEMVYAEQLLAVYENEVNIMVHQHSFYADGTQYADPKHPYSSDLDIFGKGSLFSRINRANTTLGKELLARRLAQPAEVAEIASRQQAISELTERISETFHFRAGLHGQQANQLENIAYKLKYDLQQQLAFTRNKTLRIYTAFSPYLTLAGLILGYLYGDKAWSLFAIYLFFNICLNFAKFKAISQLHAGFSGGSGLLNAVSGTITWLENIAWKSSYIQQFSMQQAQGRTWSRQIKALSQIIIAFDTRLNILVGSVLNILMLYDLRCAFRLERWYQQSAKGMLRGLETISHFEELISLATLRYNEPAWAYPVISASFCLEGIELGHPLIEEPDRVTNTYNFELQPTIDIITGSNMAGKSTFLRTVGINIVLAYTGAPVCAKSFKVSLFNLLSYMRIKDSLNEQTSTFKAELNRLKMILEGVDQLPNALVLIDEMLRGTNSRDKYLGSRVFIAHLISKNTPALFATHDLQLSEMAANHPAAVRNYHFDIQLQAGEMNFDYLLKSGACSTFNAALLLKEIGLELPVSPDEAGGPEL